MRSTDSGSVWKFQMATIMLAWVLPSLIFPIEYARGFNFRRVRPSTADMKGCDASMILSPLRSPVGSPTRIA